MLRSATTSQDTIDLYTQRIQNWTDILALNEQLKLEASNYIPHGLTESNVSVIGGVPFSHERVNGESNTTSAGAFLNFDIGYRLEVDSGSIHDVWISSTSKS